MNFKRVLRKYFVPISQVIINYRTFMGINEGYLVVKNQSEFNKKEFFNRVNYYVPELSLEIIYSSKKIPLKCFFSKKPVLLYGFEYALSDRFFLNFFNMDKHKNPTEAWSWHRLIYYVSKKNDLHVVSAKERFISHLESFKQLNYSKTYVFGTGPSLINADKYDWSDGYRVVCNTVVKSDKLWNSIKPQFIVAGDAIHHFSHTKYAKLFRADLKKRLEESEVVFLYPEVFHQFVLKEFGKFQSQLFPIPSSYHETILIDLSHDFVKPSTENVFTMLQFPLAYTLSKTILFFGYDGRGKNDKMFWASSEEYNYIECMPELHEEFPSFFDFYINSKKDKSAYVNKVHGDYLDNEFIEAEKSGYTLVMLHKSNTETFNKRYIENALKEK